MLNQQYIDLGNQPSVIRNLFEYGLVRKKEVGEDKVFDFTLGNPSIPAPKKVGETIKNLVDNTNPLQLHGYSSASGFEDVKTKIAADMSRRFAYPVKASELFLTCGAAPALIACIKALSYPGAEILCLAPFFPEYSCFIGANGAKAVVVPANTKDFQIHAEEVEKFITDKTQAVIVNSPNNPSGVVFTPESLKELGVLLERKSREVGHTIYIISDEPYRELVYDGVKVPFVHDYYRNTVMCYSWSKSLSMPGDRLGYVYVPQDVDDAKNFYAAVAGAARIMGHVCSPSLIQRTVGECCTEEPDLAAYDKNRKLLYKSLTEMGYECVKPQGAFYMMVKSPDGDGDRFSKLAKEKYDLLIVPAKGFGCAEYVRISYCVSYDMIERSLPAFRSVYADMTK